jgi:PAS domain S-box-containing protein
MRCHEAGDVVDRADERAMLRRLVTLGLFSGLLICASAPARSAPAALARAPRAQITVRIFGTEHGIHNLVINDVAQDDSGFLAIATNDGIYRFDGSQFIRLETRGVNSIDTLAMASDGKLCGGGRQDVLCWDGGAFGPTGTEGLPKVAVRKLVAFRDELWAATEEGLYVRQNGGTFVPVPGWLDEPARGDLWVDALGLIAVRGTELKLRSPDGAWQGLGANIGLGTERIESVLRDRSGALWIRSAAHMWWLPAGEGWVHDVSAGLPASYDTSALALGPRGEIWVGLDRGIAMRDGDHWQVYGADEGLPAFPARSFFVDREGTLWIGSTGGGLYQLLGRGLIEHYDVAHGLPGEFVWSIRRDAHGALWVGTNRCLAHIVDNTWQCLAGTEGHTVRSFVFTADGGMYLGGAPPEVLYRDPEGNLAPVRYAAERPTQHIMAMVIDTETTLWVGTRDGLFRRTAGHDLLERVVVPGCPPDMWVSSLTLDDHQRLWFASKVGVGVLENHAWRMIDARDGLQTTSTQYVIQRHDGRICVTYLGAIGLGCFRYDRGRPSDFERVTVADGLSSGEVYLFGEDAQHRLWVGTGDGLDVEAPGTGFDHFGDRQGLVSNDCSAMAFFLDLDGSLWIGSSAGVSHLAAQHYAGPPPPPSIAVEAQLGRQPIAAAGDLMQVPHDHNAFEVRFAATSFLDPSATEHQIRMLPVEVAWRTVRLRDAAYPALPPGPYQFEARARLGTGAWGRPTVLRFEVLFPWWRAAWFYAVVGALVLSALAAAYAWRQRVVLRRKSEQLIARSDASFRAVIESMADLIAIYREDILVYINAAGLRLFGLEGTGENRADADLWNRVHPEDRSRSRERLGRDDAPGEPLELRLRAGDGSWRDCEVSALKAEFSGAPALVLEVRDITERKRMQEKLLVSDRMASLGTLAAGIAHEINNPLTYVMGNLEVLADALSGDGWPPDGSLDELRQAIADSNDGAERVRKIVKGLRSFTRAENSKVVPVDLTQVVEQAVKMTANELRHHAQLVRDLDPAPVMIADDGRLTQVFINLIMNAVHAIPPGRRDANCITVRTRADDDGGAVIEVQDTGGGIPPDVLARVFDPFFTTKDVGAGTGLGLSICHGIVIGLGGQIAIESTVGVGTTVRVSLPPGVADVVPSPGPVQPAAVGAAAAHRYCVAIVDDEARIGRALQRALGRDHEPTVFTSAQDLLTRIAGGERFDAIVSDVMMPTMTGLDLLEELQRVEPHQAARLMFITGGVFTETIKQRLNELGAPRLDKPFVLDDLRQMIARCATRDNVANRVEAAALEDGRQAVRLRQPGT